MPLDTGRSLAWTENLEQIPQTKNRPFHTKKSFVVNRKCRTFNLLFDKTFYLYVVFFYLWNTGLETPLASPHPHPKSAPKKMSKIKTFWNMKVYECPLKRNQIKLDSLIILPGMDVSWVISRITEWSRFLFWFKHQP